MRAKHELRKIINKMEILRDLHNLCRPNEVLPRQLLENQLRTLECDLRAEYQRLVADPAQAQAGPAAEFSAPSQECDGADRARNANDIPGVRRPPEG